VQGGDNVVTTTIEQLRVLREDRSVRQLADEVGTSAEMIRRWLRGEAQPRADRAETIRQLFIELKKPKAEVNVSHCLKVRCISSEDGWVRLYGTKEDCDKINELIESLGEKI